jgi:hypothetical protein
MHVMHKIVRIAAALGWIAFVCGNAAASPSDVTLYDGRTHDVPLKPGNHTLEVTALDPGVVLDRFEISFAGAGRAYDPVPETGVVR